MSDIKSFFNEWCAKSRKEAAYESRPTGKEWASRWIVLLCAKSIIIIEFRSQALDPILVRGANSGHRIRRSWELDNKERRRKECGERFHQFSGPNGPIECEWCPRGCPWRRRCTASTHSRCRFGASFSSEFFHFDAFAICSVAASWF